MGVIKIRAGFFVYFPMLKLKRYFLTGLLLILPLFITFYILILSFKFIDGILGGFINNYLRANWGFFIPGIGIILGILIVWLTGFIATHFLGKRMLSVLENRFVGLPGVRQIYPSAKQIVGFLFSKDKAAFKQVVLAEYPSKGIWSIGFLTNEAFDEAGEKIARDLAHVFIPSTPGPWSGFLILVPRKDIKLLDMSVEGAIKLIISGGILKP